MNTKKIILLGDSLTQLGSSENGCWASLLQDHILNNLNRKNIDVINRGRYGFTTQQFKEELLNMLPEFELYKNADIPMMFTILLGSNDCFYGLPLAEYETNLIEILNTISIYVHSPKHILLISPSMYDKDMWNNQQSQSGGTEVIEADLPLQEIHDRCVRVSESTNTSFIDLYESSKSLLQDLRPEEVFCDGLHFAPKLSQKLFNLIRDTIEQNFLLFNHY